MLEKMTTITKAYKEFAPQLQSYVAKRINNIEEAADIVQDVFVRILSYDLISKETIKSLCYTIANNLVIDHLRRHYKRQEVFSYAYDMQQKKQELTPEQIAAFHDLAEREKAIMMEMSPSTAKVYEMTRLKEMSIEEIATELNISRRTVECHQFKARKFIREQLRKII